MFNMAGFGQVVPTEPSRKNRSEMLFEAYLRSSGYADFAFEPEIPNTAKRPDYRLSSNGHDLLFEIKEFRAEPDDLTAGFRYFDPYQRRNARERSAGLKCRPTNNL